MKRVSTLEQVRYPRTGATVLTLFCHSRSPRPHLNSVCTRASPSTSPTRARDAHHPPNPKPRPRPRPLPTGPRKCSKPRHYGFLPSLYCPRPQLPSLAISCPCSSSARGRTLATYSNPHHIPTMPNKVAGREGSQPHAAPFDIGIPGLGVLVHYLLLFLPPHSLLLNIEVGLRGGGGVCNTPFLSCFRVIPLWPPSPFTSVTLHGMQTCDGLTGSESGHGLATCRSKGAATFIPPFWPPSPPWFPTLAPTSTLGQVVNKTHNPDSISPTPYGPSPNPNSNLNPYICMHTQLSFFPF